MDNGVVFERYEKKYILTQAQYEAFLYKIASKMTVDQYGKTTILSLYYDTPAFDLIRRSLDKPVFKEKFRIRSYGVPKNKDHMLFLELKKKYKGIVYKRRFNLPLQQAYTYMQDGTLPGERTQIQKEIDYAKQFYHLEPKVMVIVDRTAYTAIDGSGLRMTIDENMRARETNLDFLLGDEGTPFFQDKKFLLEIKVEGACPLWLSKILSELEIFPRSFSKYGNYYQQMVKRGFRYV